MGRAADIIHQHVDAAEFVHAGLDHGGDRSAVGDVALMGDDLAADGLHLGHGLGDAVEIAIGGENLGAFLGETHAGGAAVAPAGADAAGAGDERDAILQASGHGFVPVSLRAGAN